MISWWWMIPAWFIGCLLGVFVMCLAIAASNRDDME